MRSSALVFLSGCLVTAACAPIVTSGSGTGGKDGGSTGTGGATGTGTGGSGGNGGACEVDADCGATRLCGFAESAGCAGKGRCFPSPGAICELYSPGCACDGTEINVACTGLPDGYVSKPLAHTGACGDGGCGPVNICLSTVTCASDANCAALGSTCELCTKLCGCGAPDAASCCPTGWLMYTCTQPAGGTGLACHNPELGCASSLTCGEGCDDVVDGRCDGG